MTTPYIHCIHVRHMFSHGFDKRRVTPLYSAWANELAERVGMVEQL